MDLLYIYDKFFFNLPDTQQEFKREFKKLFPTVYDTKFMLNQSYSMI